MLWRLARDLISVVPRTELTARGSSVPLECETAHLGKTRVARPCKAIGPRAPSFLPELELKLIQSQMTQAPVLRGKVDARALRA